MEGAHRLAEGQGKVMDDRIVQREDHQDADARGIERVPEVSKPGGGDPAENQEADQPGENQRAKFIDMAHAAAHAGIDIRIKDVKIVSGIENGRCEEAEEEKKADLITAGDRATRGLGALLRDEFGIVLR